MVFVCRGQPPFRVLLACGRSCCYGLSHFLQLTFPCWHSRVCFHSTSSISCFTPLLPTARKSCHSFAHCVPFHSFHFQGICLFPPCKSMWLQPCSVSLHTASPPHTYTLSVHSFQYTPFVHYFQPLHFQRNVRAKKCAKPAAGSTRPPRSALPVSGALAPLAAARTQRTGFILRFVSLLSHFSLAIHAGSRLFLLFGLNLLLPRQPPATHP